MVMHACNPWTHKTKAGGFPWVQNQPGLHSEFLSPKNLNRQPNKHKRCYYRGGDYIYLSILRLHTYRSVSYVHILCSVPACLCAESHDPYNSLQWHNGSRCPYFKCYNWKTEAHMAKPSHTRRWQELRECLPGHLAIWIFTRPSAQELDWSLWHG